MNHCWVQTLVLRRLREAHLSVFGPHDIVFAVKWHVQTWLTGLLAV